MAGKPTLSQADVVALLKNPSDENRASAAGKVAETFSTGALSSKERELAEDIFRTMVHDAAVRVRVALSEALQENPDVPHDVAATLARDIDEVALPMIEKSSVLTDEDLIERSFHKKSVFLCQSCCWFLRKMQKNSVQLSKCDSKIRMESGECFVPGTVSNRNQD